MQNFYAHLLHVRYIFLILIGENYLTGYGCLKKEKGVWIITEQKPSCYQYLNRNTNNF
jgi:hypothetical protein